MSFCKSDDPDIDPNEQMPYHTVRLRTCGGDHRVRGETRSGKIAFRDIGSWFGMRLRSHPNLAARHAQIARVNARMWQNVLKCSNFTNELRSGIAQVDTGRWWKMEDRTRRICSILNPPISMLSSSKPCSPAFRDVPQRSRVFQPYPRCETNPPHGKDEARGMKDEEETRVTRTQSLRLAQLPQFGDQNSLGDSAKADLV
jgi:hypothetical protein